jgi:Tfp pilus assembly protein PilF
VPNNKAFAFLQTEYVWLRLLPVRWVVLLLFAPAGIWAAAKWGNRDALFVLLFYAVIYSAANIAFFICDRYRYPVWPVMAAIAGGGLLAFVQSICQQRWRAAVCLSASMALMAAISLPNWFDARLPTFARDYLFRSVACYEKGHFREALKDVDQSLALDPEDVTAMHHRGNVLLALYDYDGARKEYERTSKINAEDSGVWNNLGVALDKLGRTDEAAQAFRRAMQCDAPSKNAFIGLAFEQLRAGRLADAAATLDQLDKLENEPNAAKLIIRSVIARRSGDAAKADALETQARHFDSAAAEWALKNAAGTGQGAASAVTPAQ